MAFPKKGSRCLVIDGVTYRYTGLFCEKDRVEGVEVNEFRVQLADKPQQVLRAEFGYPRLRAEYERVGKHVSRYLDRVPPYVVRQTVLLALSKGWEPSARWEAQGDPISEKGEGSFLINLDEVAEAAGATEALIGESPSWFDDERWRGWWWKLPQSTMDQYFIRAVVLS